VTSCNIVRGHKYRMSWMFPSIAQSLCSSSSRVCGLQGVVAHVWFSCRPSRHCSFLERLLSWAALAALGADVLRLRGSTWSAQPCFARLPAASCTRADVVWCVIDVFVCWPRETIVVRSAVVASIVRDHDLYIRFHKKCQGIRHALTKLSIGNSSPS
jgi:hypothetical protein